MEIFTLKESNKHKIHEWKDEVLSRFLGRTIQTHDFEYNQHKKPFLKTNPFYFNISHSEDYAILAVAEKPIGIDIQKIKSSLDINDIKKMAERFFCDSEKKNIGDNRDVFFQYWVRKEALMKAVGEGMKMGFDAVDVSRLLVFYDGSHWEISDLKLEFLGYKGAICHKSLRFL